MSKIKKKEDLVLSDSEEEEKKETKKSKPKAKAKSKAKTKTKQDEKAPQTASLPSNAMIESGGGGIGSLAKIWRASALEHVPTLNRKSLGQCLRVKHGSELCWAIIREIMDAYECLHKMPKNRERFPAFPATMPDTVDEKTLHEIAQDVAKDEELSIPIHSRKWFVSPKANGIRMLFASLSLIRSARVFHVLINRKWDMWLVKVQTTKGATERTIMDGELMDTDDKYHFQAFDLVSICGLDTRNHRLFDRQILLQEYLKDVRGVEEFPLEFSIKKYDPVSVDKLVEIQKLTQQRPEEYEGAMFAQNMWPIVSGTDTQGLLKLKECQLQTSDLFLQVSDDRKMVHLYNTENGIEPNELAVHPIEVIFERNKVAKDKNLKLEELENKVCEFTVERIILEKIQTVDENLQPCVQIKDTFVHKIVRDRSHEKDKPNIGGVIRRIYQALREELNFDKVIGIFQHYKSK